MLPSMATQTPEIPSETVSNSVDSSSTTSSDIDDAAADADELLLLHELLINNADSSHTTICPHLTTGPGADAPTATAATPPNLQNHQHQPPAPSKPSNIHNQRQNAGGGVFATRDEDDHSNELVNHVLLGGILIAPPTVVTPVVVAHSGTNAKAIPTSADGQVLDDVVAAADDDALLAGGSVAAVLDDLTLAVRATATQCRPECVAAQNELCQRVDAQMRCVCRPGFSRMFPDQPCKRESSLERVWPFSV